MVHYFDIILLVFKYIYQYIMFKDNSALWLLGTKNLIQFRAAAS